MTRLPLIGDDGIPSAASSRSNSGFGFVPNLYRTLANAPVLLDAWIQFAWTLREQCESSRALRELCILRVAILTDAEYEWEAHVPMALAAGCPPDQIRALREWEGSSHFDELEACGLRLTDELTTTGTVSDATWSDLYRRLDDRQSVEVVLTVAFYACVSRVLRGLAVPSDADRWTTGDARTTVSLPFR